MWDNSSAEEKDLRKPIFATQIEDRLAQDLKVEASSIKLWDNRLWDNVVKILALEVDAQIFSAYLDPLRFVSFNQDKNVLTLKTPSKFILTQIERGFKDKILNAFEKELATTFASYLHKKEDLLLPLSLSLLVDDFLNEAKPPETSPYIIVKKTNNEAARSKNNPQAVETIVENRLNSRYLFDNFVVGNSNQFCHAASLRVAEEPGQSYNPLFIYGGVGLGKTHLLHAIGNEALRKDPKRKVLYISSEAFTNELIYCLRNSKMEEFKQKFRSLEVLLIDDIQFIVGKERTQEEFFHTFNALYEAKHQIVITSDKMPSEIPGIEERLQTRFSWGLMADLQAPDFETRVAILKEKASLEQVEIPEEAYHLIADRVSSNVRELEGALTRISALSSLNKIPLTLDTVEAMLKPIIQPKMVRITVDDIKKAVSHYFEIKPSEIVSKRRTRNLSFPRHIAMYLCRKHTTASYPDIGDQFGGRDHSSVIHSANVVTTKLKTDPEVKEAIEAIEKRILGV